MSDRVQMKLRRAPEIVDIFFPTGLLKLPRAFAPGQAGSLRLCADIAYRAMCANVQIVKRSPRIVSPPSRLVIAC
jgi:hypothetical protein